MRRILPVLLLLPLGAQAEGQFEVFSCTFDGGSKAVQVWVDGDYLTYEFGDGNKSTELSLAELLDDGTFAPWPGVGSTIWESVFFYNEDYVYEVWSSWDRDPNVAFADGGINVANAKSGVAELVCDAGSVYSNFEGLSETLYARGMCWDHTSQQWLFGGCD